MAFFDRKREDGGEWTGFLEQGIKVDGRLESTGTFRIDCTMKGTLVSEQTLVVGEHAAIEGQIEGSNIIVSGKFDGVIKARTKVEIQTKAVVTGEIHAPCLVIEAGAIFDGQCHMLAATGAGKAVTIPIRSATIHS
jgi:cytoskeletal protein CcmA (bactofilin family)